MYSSLTPHEKVHIWAYKDLLGLITQTKCMYSPSFRTHLESVNCKQVKCAVFISFWALLPAVGLLTGFISDKPNVNGGIPTPDLVLSYRQLWCSGWLIARCDCAVYWSLNKLIDLRPWRTRRKSTVWCFSAVAVLKLFKKVKTNDPY